MSRGDCRIYVGNLPPDIRSRDIEDLFYKFGKIAFVDLKTRRGPPFAFVEFNDSRDAKDAVYSRDGYDYDGYKLRVEFPRGRERGPGGVFKSNLRRGGSNSLSRQPGYRVKITGLPPTGSWQDLKDHMREAGDVCFADVYKDGTGVVEFLRYEDMRYALKKLDDTRFRSHEGEVSYIRITEDKNSRNYRDKYSRSRSRSRSPSKRSRGSPTYSPANDDDDDEDDDHRSRRSRSSSRRSGDDDDDRDSRSHSRTPSPEEKTNGRGDSRSYSRSRSRSGSYRSRSPSHGRSEESDRSKSRSPSKD